MLYQDINAIIAKNDAELSVAESHGMAAGMLCANNRIEPEFWLREIMQDIDVISIEDKTVLMDLFQQTKDLLCNDEFSFALLLPAENFPLYDQIVALRQWCHGFLFGIGTTSATVNWTKDSRDVMKDIAEFTKLEAETEGEDSENDFMEITEYLRAAVIFLHTELNSSDIGSVH
jgi:uncharacterized protein